VADFLERGSAWLDEQRLKHLSRTVTYRRGEDFVEVRAAIGRTVFEVDDSVGVAERTESRDFLIPASDLVLGEQATLPKRGDHIEETQDATVYVYEVMAPGQEPCWKYSDAYRRTLRVHTKQVGTEEAA